MEVHFNIVVNGIPEKNIFEDIPGKDGKFKIKNCDRFFQLIENNYDRECLRCGQDDTYIEVTQAKQSLFNNDFVKGELTKALQNGLSSIQTEEAYSDFTIANSSIGLFKNGQMWLNISLDMHVMMKVNFWPSIAQEWKTRDRMWPSKDIITEMTKSCYITAKSDDVQNEGDNVKSFDFGYSFHNLEVELAKLMSPEQKMIYLKYKSIFNGYIDPIDPERIPGSLGKTIMMRAMEILAPDDSLWKDNDAFLRRLFTLSLEAVESEELADYFIPSLNVMEKLKKAYPHKKNEIRKKLKEIIENVDRFLNELPVNDAVEFYTDVASACQKIVVDLKRIDSPAGTVL